MTTVASGRQLAWLAAMPWVFVAIWSTGFVVARFGMPFAPPMRFLAWRFALSVLAFGVWVLLSRAAWPKGRAQWLHLAVVGTLGAGFIAQAAQMLMMPVARFSLSVLARSQAADTVGSLPTVSGSHKVP